LRRFQIWNEENDINFSRASVSEYVTLLKVSRRALRAVDRRSRIVLGGLYSRPKKGHSIYAKVFLRRLYRHRGVKRLFDGVALHPYSFNPGLMAKAIREARREMVRAGDGGTALYITEFGWGSQRPAEGGDGFEKGPRKQAAYLRRAYRILLANRKRWR